jgi:intracellular septation protein A
MTELQSPVLRAEQRSWSYWFDDGLPNLVAGVACLLIGFGMLAAQARPRKPLVIVFGAIAFVLYGVVLIRMKQVIEWLKARITYPRTGYAAPPYFTQDMDTLPLDLTVLTLNGADAKKAWNTGRLHEDRNRRAGLVVGLTLMGLAAAWFIESRWICLAAGILVGLAIWLGTRKHERASWIEVVAFPFAGMYSLIFRTGKVDRLAVFVVGGGLALVLTGGLRLFQYLRRNPVPSA